MTSEGAVGPALRDLPLVWRLPRMVRRLRELYFADFVFIHINKTGGSSIERALGLPFEHCTALEKRAMLGERRWAKRFTFAIVRNPWDRVLSHYAYRVRTNQTGLGDRHLEFRDWVRLTYGEQAPPYYDQPKMFMPQWRWISDDSGTLLVDFVGRFERLSEDFETVCRRIERSASLPHLKRSDHEHYRAAYDDATAELVASWFSDDIERFAYAY